MMVPCPTCDTAYGPVDATPAEKARFSDRHILKLESQLAEARAVLNVVQVRGSAGACPACYEFADDSESDAKSDRHVDWEYGDAKNVRALKGHAPDCRLAKALR
jgi:hypothetical protein